MKILPWSKTGHSRKEKEEAVHRRGGGKTLLKSGHERTQLGQLKTRQGRKVLLQSYLWCPDDLSR